MKGIIFNIFEQFICENWSVETYEAVFARCPLKTKEPYVGPLSYPDSDLAVILSKTCEMLDIELDEGLKRFGAFAFEKLQAKYPELVSEHAGARNFLMTIDSVIHTEIKKLYPDAQTPRFTYLDLSDTQLVMNYQSKRQMCALVEGLIQGVAKHFNTEIQCEHTKCIKRGDELCEFDLRFPETVEND